MCLLFVVGHLQSSLGMPPHLTESVFEPNQQINLHELPSDERDIESFKRFNYFFEPPKSKLKVNLNVQDIYNNSRGSQESPSNASPHHWEQQ